MNKKEKIVIVITLIFAMFITVGFTNMSRTPKTVYRHISKSNCYKHGKY